MKIDDSDLRDILTVHGLNARRNNYVCDCPICGKEKHFYISIYTQKWDCKKCGESGGIYKLLRHIDKLYLLKEGKTIKRTELIQTINQVEESNELVDSIEIDMLPKRSLPAGSKLCFGNPYLKSRGLTDDDISYYGIYNNNLLSKFKDYILFPVFDGGEIKGFVGRYSNKKVPKDVLRYKNNLGFDSSKLLYGYDEIVEGETLTVILVEGIFDKIAVDKFLELRSDNTIKCICTFGKKISPYQKKKLLQKKIRNIILLYDFDAIPDIKKIGVELDEYFFTTITYTDKKDIDCCTKDEAFEVFNNLRRPVEFNYDVIGKVKR